MAELLFPNVIRALDANGDPVEGAELRAYRSGTTTALTLYSDTSGATAIAVPLVADSDGVFAMPIYNTSAFAVKIDVVDPVTSVSLPGYPIDPVLAGVDDNIAASDVTFAATTDITSTNVQDAIEEVDNHWRAAKTGIDDDIVSGTAGTDGTSLSGMRTVTWSMGQMCWTKTTWRLIAPRRCLLSRVSRHMWTPRPPAGRFLAERFWERWTRRQERRRR
jgi:hypothetical protein